VVLASHLEPVQQAWPSWPQVALVMQMPFLHESPPPLHVVPLQQASLGPPQTGAPPSPVKPW
jgi:hypothetical protein